LSPKFNTPVEVLPEFAWLGDKTTGLARASCSTKEHIRAIDGSVPVEKTSNLHAGPCRAEMAEIEVAQNAPCFATPPGLAKSRQRIDGHRRSSTQIPEEPRLIVLLLFHQIMLSIYYLKKPPFMAAGTAMQNPITQKTQKP